MNDYKEIVSLNRISLLWIVVAAYGIFFIASVCMTWIVLQYVANKSILDIPNERSSHITPIPRGGGIAIFLLFNFIITILNSENILAHDLYFALLGGVPVAVVGYADDIFTVAPRWRLAVHISSALWVIYWLDILVIPGLIPYSAIFSPFIFLLTVAGIVWCINLYNFMDGIDGIAGSEAVFIGLVSSVALLLVGDKSVAILSGFLSMITAGFTVWNWSPAKIFLGDAGSGFLGYTLAVIGLHTVNRGYLPFSWWWIIGGVFICDSTFTLISRIWRKQCWYGTHREFFFHYLISRGKTHMQITISNIFFNIFVLLPIAILAVRYVNFSGWIMAGTTVMLWFFWIVIRIRVTDNLAINDGFLSAKQESVS